MVDRETHAINFTLNIVGILFDSSACLISLIILICILFEQYKTRLKRQERIILILCADIYLYICLFSATQLLISCWTLVGDLYQIHFNFTLCVFVGYFITVLESGLYYGFVVQGFFRLCRTVYSQYRWLQFNWFYIIAAPVQLLIAAVFLSPLLLWNDFIYLPNENYCYIIFTNIRGISWSVLNIYMIPLLIFSLIYFRIVKYIRIHATNQTLVMRNKQKQDLLVIRRIFITCGLLFLLITPTAIFVLLAYINHVEYSLTHRMTMFSYAMAMLVLSIEMIFVTPQLKILLLKIFRRNRVIPIHGNFTGIIPMRPVSIVG